MTESIDWAAARVFGQRIEGKNYIVRPGAYGVILDADRRIAVLRVGEGCYLPGGGSEPGESFERTLKREIAEECGREIVIRRCVGNAVQLVFAEDEGYFEKRCVFFEGCFGAVHAISAEADHRLVWLEPRVALAELSQPSQVWAVAKVVTP